MADAISDESKTKSKRNKKANTKKKKGKKESKLKGSSKIKKNKARSQYEELEESYENREDTEGCYISLEAFYDKLNEIDLDSLITEDNLNYLKNLNPSENLRIDILLNKIYFKILSSEDFYKSYFLDDEENKDKLPLVMELIDESIDSIDGLMDYFISYENFQLKENLLKLIKFIYINLKSDLNDKQAAHIKELMEELPQDFYSPNYLELMKFKSIIYKNNEQLLKNISEIDSLFLELETYYEQLNCFELLFNDIETDELNEKSKNYSSISNKDIKKKRYKRSKREENSDEEETKNTTKTRREEYDEEDIISYGQFLLKMCIYQKFQIKKGDDVNDEAENNEEEEEDDEDQEEGEDQEEEEEEEEEEEAKKSKNKNKSKNKSKDKKDNKVDNKKKNKKEKSKKAKKEDNDESESNDDDSNILSFYLLDAKNQKSDKKGKKKSKTDEDDLEKALNGKYCISLYDQKGLLEVLKKNIDNFNKMSSETKNKTIKSLQKKLSLYLESLNENKCIPISVDNINNIKYFCNFSKNRIVVPNRDSTIFYIENNENKKGLILVEFSLVDDKKDIIFKINKYIPSTDEFKVIHDSGKINKKCKFCLYFEEKAIYQIEFDNNYSWINSKEVNLNISVLRVNGESIEDKEEEINNEDLIDNNDNEVKVDKKKSIIKKEKNNRNISDEDDDDIEDKDENKEEVENSEETEEKLFGEFTICKPILNNKKEIKFSFINGKKKFTFNCNKIYKKVKNYQILESNNLLQNKGNCLSILVGSNKMRIIKVDKNEKITYIEAVYEDGNLLSKEFFIKTLSNYLNENYKINENDENSQKLSINIYSQNGDLTLTSKKMKDLVSALKDNSLNNMDPNQSKLYSQFVQKIGFYPDEKLGKYEITYHLYDFSEQCLIYHLFLNQVQGKKSKNSTLILIFDKYSLKLAALNDGAIFTKFNSLENSWNKKYYSKLKMDVFKSITDFITAVSESFEGLDLVLCYMDNEEKKNNLIDLFKQIKEYTAEKIDESTKVYIYNEDNFFKKIFKYIGLFSNE